MESAEGALYLWDRTLADSHKLFLQNYMFLPNYINCMQHNS